ncbi:MAG TPA: hypothetical protein VK787_14270 [Puia sp.]|jgi:hypothetical protein|nr:hypothetical protein [Puia sp.]
MSSTVIQNQTLIEGEFTQNVRNDSADRILGMVSYFKDNRIWDIKDPLDNLKWDSVNFHIPSMSKYFPIDYKNSFRKSQNWIGYVTEVYPNSFKAKIQDANIQNSTYEDAEFDFEDIENEDKKLIKLGNAFYWSVGHEIRRGTLSKQSIIRFKRLPKLSSADFDEAIDLAEDLNDNINWD